MLSSHDVLGLCGLDEAEVLAIAEHEHITVPNAAAMASQLVETTDGCEQIRQMIEDDIEIAERMGNAKHVRELQDALAHFLSEHPECRH